MPHDPRRGVDLDGDGEDRHDAGLGGGALGDFALEQHDEPLGPVRSFEEAAQDRRGRVVGKVGDDAIGGAAGQLPGVGGEHVGGDDAKPGVAGVAVAQPLCGALVLLDGDDGAGAGEKLTGERPRPGADLDDEVVGGELAGVGDAAQGAGVDEEVLPKALARPEPVAVEEGADEPRGAGSAPR